MSGTVTVEVFGRRYALRTDEPEESVKELAAVVDAEMKAIARSASAADTTKIAVLAALRLADRLRDAGSLPASLEPSARLLTRLRDLVDLIDREALG